jgi:hypothetical protein
MQSTEPALAQLVGAVMRAAGARGCEAGVRHHLHEELDASAAERHDAPSARPGAPEPGFVDFSPHSHGSTTRTALTFVFAVTVVLAALGILLSRRLESHCA